MSVKLLARCSKAQRKPTTLFTTDMELTSALIIQRYHCAKVITKGCLTVAKQRYTGNLSFGSKSMALTGLIPKKQKCREPAHGRGDSTVFVSSSYELVYRLELPHGLLRSHQEQLSLYYRHPA